VIDKCNDADEEIAQFFQHVETNNVKEVQRCIDLNPSIAYEVNDGMETILHVAVVRKHIEMVEYLLEQDFGKHLAKAKDLRRMTPVDVSKFMKQVQIIKVFKE